jgi:MtN3 and saliva related transmembrane protein
MGLWQLFVEIGFFLSLMANAILFIPQAAKLYRAKNAVGVSVLTFLGFNVIQAFTMLHAYLTKDILLFIGNFLSFITCGIVTYFSILYRRSE